MAVTIIMLVSVCFGVLFVMRSAYAEPSCSSEQLESCRTSVIEGRVMLTTGGGRCYIRAYDRFTHVCDIATNYLPNVGHCCCEMNDNVALCCRYRQSAQIFRCDQHEDVIYVSRYSSNSYLVAILIPVSLITLTAVVLVIACCCRHQYKHMKPDWTVAACCYWRSSADTQLPANENCSPSRPSVTSSASVCFRSFLTRIRSSGNAEQCVKHLRPPRITSQSHLEPSAPSQLDGNYSSTCLHCSQHRHSSLAPPSYEESRSHQIVCVSVNNIPPEAEVTITEVTVADVERTFDVSNDSVQQ